MKRVFRSRVSPPLTATQLYTLTRQSHLSAEELEEWHQRFTHCYPRGYLSFKEFLFYLQQLNTPTKNNEQKRPMKSMLKQLFRILDLNEDKQLNFEEFFLFNLLINRGTEGDKLKLILNLYDREKTKYLTLKQLENVLTDMFDLLNIPQPPDGISRRIDWILSRAELNSQDSKISWQTFRNCILNDPTLFALLVPNHHQTQHVHEDDDDDNSSWIVTRF